MREGGGATRMSGHRAGNRPSSPPIRQVAQNQPPETQSIT